ncbi:tyrosine-type recombinase/integrase [Paenibacillus zanthoxyli]|uniref:tyrosine-type recombinase/integrase n=1 Tax=Paenibacillus zanthoxyli TaxID=369399 RepID=UPI00046F7373|nr:site-specific integrase [Paenibacillus zanthoxyli]
MANWQDKGNGKYKLIAELGYDAKGKRMREFTTITLDRKPRKGELDLEAAKFEDAVKNGTWQKPLNMGFEEFVLNDWKKNYADIEMGDYTRKNVMSLIKCRLIPEFGRYQLDRISTIQIVRYFTSLSEPAARKDKRKGALSTNTLINIYKALKSIFDTAKEWKLIVRNPMDGVKRPKPGKSELRKMKNRKKSYTSEEVERAITALYNEPDTWKLYFIGVLLGGYRRGEFLATEWPDCDFDNNQIYVGKQITLDEEGRSVEGEVKTIESEGYVPMPSWYMIELRLYKRRQIRERMKMKPGEWKGGDKRYAFHSGYGEKYYPNTPSLRWRRILDKYNLPRIRLHDLRHTTALLLRKYGADLKTIQSQLRHSRLATTTDIYMERDTGPIGEENLFEVFDPKKQRGHQMDTTS